MQQVHQGNIGSNFDLVLTLNNDDKKDSLDKFMLANYLPIRYNDKGNLNSKVILKKLLVERALYDHSKKAQSKKSWFIN